MDLNKFFSSLNPTSSNSWVKDEYDSFSNSPFYKLKVFERLIINGLSFKESIMKFFSQSVEDLDMVGVDLAGEFMMYNRAWFWVSQLDWDDTEWVIDLEKVSNEKFLTAIKLSINYFEEHEEYEKCAFLKKIQDFVQEYLASKN
jgi:hypothetical protein